MRNTGILWLKAAFLIGAITDAMALVPMLVPEVAGIFWGFDLFTGEYYVAMGMGASLMLAWTILLLWAYHKPLERRYIGLFTIIIIAGFIITEIVAVALGYIGFDKILVSLVIQVILTALFSYSFAVTRRSI